MPSSLVVGASPSFIAWNFENTRMMFLETKKVTLAVPQGGGIGALDFLRRIL